MTEQPSEFHPLAPLRPAIHLTPPIGWMNDPNGLCRLDGIWHAYYQHDPTTIVHGTMHWGHSTSTDLLHWEHHDIALAPDELGVIFSGSAVIDAANTAGFGANALIAVFTHDLDRLQRQSLAYSTDGGATFSKFDGNPVLEGDVADFRDPKVVKTDDGWAMALAVGEQVNFYSSHDLRSWIATGTYRHPLDDGGVWECPDLLHFPESDDPAITHVLTVCASRAGAHNHSGTLYIPGTFRSGTFTPAADPQLLDYGPDFYATQTFYTCDHGDPIALAWMNSWEYSTTQPARDYRGVMSVARRIELVGGHVRQRPVLDGARCSEPLASHQPVASEPQSALSVTAAGDLTITLTGHAGRAATIVIGNDTASITRHGDVMDNYAEHYSARLDGPGEHQVIIDHGTIEVFAANGRVTLSALVFAGAEWTVDVVGAATVHRVR